MSGDVVGTESEARKIAAFTRRRMSLKEATERMKQLLAQRAVQATLPENSHVPGAAAGRIASKEGLTGGAPAG